MVLAADDVVFQMFELFLGPFVDLGSRDIRECEYRSVKRYLHGFVLVVELFVLLEGDQEVSAFGSVAVEWFGRFSLEASV